ncbi:MAG: hypothetical protein ACRCTI_18560 [Beijerinckiaceae bacterium]
MRWILAAALAAVAATATLRASEPAAPASPEVRRFEATTTGTLTVEPDGSVSAVDLPPALEAPFRDAYLEAIRRWRFEPIVRDGRAVRAEGHMSLGLYLEAEGTERLRAGFERVSFINPPSEDPPTKRITLRIEYPAALLRSGIGGEVEVVVERDDEGRVLRAAARRGALYTADTKPTAAMRRAMGQLARAAVDAARRLPTPSAPDQRVVVMPVTFAASGPGNAFWRPVLDIPLEPPAWVLAAVDAEWVSVAGDTPSTLIRPLQTIDGTEVLDKATPSAGG